MPATDPTVVVLAVGANHVRTATFLHDLAATFRAVVDLVLGGHPSLVVLLLVG